MNLLLDTHILIWTLNDDPALSETARELILDPNNVVYYSTVSVWEIAIKHAAHPDNVEFTGKFALETLKRPEDAPKHNDPFDRILVSQAKAENMVFLTHDSLIPYYGERCIMSV